MGGRNEPPRLPEGSFAAWSRDRLGMARRGAEECGDVWQLEPGVYVAAAAEPCEAVLRRAHDFPKAPSPLFPPLKRSSGEPTPEERGYAHAARMRGLRAQAVAARIGEIAPRTARFADQLPTGQDIEILPPVRHALAEIGVHYLFGEDAPTLLPYAFQLFLAREVLVRPSRWVWPRWVPTPGRRFRTRQQAAFTDALRPVVRRRRASGMLGDDMLGQMLRPSPHHGLLPEEAVLDTLPGITVATFETPSRAAGWILLHLALYPQAAGRVAREAALLPADPAATTSAHLGSLRYTQALVNEVLRLYPPSWLLTRRVRRQTQLADYTIDAGSTVLVCPYTAHRDAREFAEPDEFRPERWLDDPGSPAKPGVFLSFGTGPHGCEGAALAMAMLTLLTAQTARCYHLSEPAGPEPGYQVTTLEGLAPVGLRLRATARG
ncbi:cytochrome P450 [Streptomyces sp. 900105755]|uniref:cytochrome P450 n=1 Tax=Streptomyces sp. Ag109_O5-10 TaxID=1855349 RepID=UPI00089A0D04|nr:cytochrome P450 [Streptomyces sp. Ag109_O5-10]SEE57730.1 Cytochrome P450 [Streptomyces sp. Ag109_O5-10]